MSEKSVTSSSIGMNSTLAATLVVSGAALAATTTDANAELVITQLGGEQFSIGDIGSFGFDLNDDGTNDFIIEGFNNDGIFGASIFVQEDNSFKPGIFVQGDDPFAHIFQPGDTVGGLDDGIGVSLFETPLFLTFAADLFFGNDGPFAEDGATGFVGLALFGPFDDRDAPFGNFFGFAEITRGSITLNSIGFQNSVNTGAQIPSAVPLPATLGLLAAGYGGLLALRRRKRNKA